MIPQAAINYSHPSDWVRAHLRDDFDVCECAAGSQVLDVGCGYGRNLERLRERGIKAAGIDPDHGGLEHCRGLGLCVQRGSAEQLPFPRQSFDHVILDGVLQFADPRRALAEIHRVLRPGGSLRLVTQGAGYGLHVMFSRQGRGRLFGLRIALSGSLFALTGMKLGDTVCYSPRKVRAMCQAAGFEVRECVEGPRHFGLPVFVYLAASRP